MFRKIISSLPILVLLAGIGIFVFHYSQQHKKEQDLQRAKEAAVAEKINVLPQSDDTEDLDQQIAQRAFASPEQIDGAPPVSYGEVRTPEKLYDDPPGASSSNLTFATKSMQHQPVQRMPEAIEGQPNAPVVYFQNSIDARSTRERVDPQSRAYTQRVNDLMEIRQRRLQGELRSNEE